MQTPSNSKSRLIDCIIEHIDIPLSYYEKAAGRHRSLGEWLLRDSSAVRHLDPDVRPQGSFRFGTVNRPLAADAKYDLDNVCVMQTLSKSHLTQRQLKELYGAEIRAYAREHGMIAPVEELNRCWRLQYADEVSFHLDTLPCVPDERVAVERLTAADVSLELAQRVVAITDLRDPHYEQITSLWPSSNPRGFAKWFEMRAALGRQLLGRYGEARASVEDVPPYGWKTTLQRSIQLLKRHRDVMFEENPDLAPISMIITNLAARSYEGEADVWTALFNIVEKMPNHIRPSWPRVPNPTDPFEDYADKWRTNPALERSFEQWHAAVKADIARLARLMNTPNDLADEVETMFRVTLTRDQLRSVAPSGTSVPSVAAVPTVPTLVIPSAAKPWGRHVR